ACAIPAVMAARTIENWRDRLVTILLVPLMSCSARLPVYTLLIAAFIPHKMVLGIFSLQGLVLMGIYFLGMITAIFVALIFKKIFKPRSSVSMIMELPPYRMPLLRSLWWTIYERAKSFLTTAGTIILAVSVVLWFLASFPLPDKENPPTSAEQIERSYAGQIGHFIEPIIKPLGYDWKIGVGLLTSFAAREVIISTLSTLYNLEEGPRQHTTLIESLRNDKKPDGTPVYSILVAISLMVFYAYAAQCMATFAIVKRETNSWRWPLFMVGYMTILAYLASLFVYQFGRILGWA
ncbi:MAG TPA: ferrous iron transporter B, partial [Calditrichaeota bacterium]|nr:ferrous iron transporter B [Calditrichota bacterium]